MSEETVVQFSEHRSLIPNLKLVSHYIPRMCKSFWRFRALRVPDSEECHSGSTPAV